MFEEASNRITVWLSKTKIISSDQEVVCKWGMTHILDTLFNIATFTAIGLLFRMLPERKPGQRGRTKRGKVLCLIDRLSAHKGEVCLFAHDFDVPFDNNQAERDIRNIKVKTKVSGCFRSVDGAKEYLKIMSYVSTAIKHGFTSFDAIRRAVMGNSMSIFAQDSE